MAGPFRLHPGPAGDLATYASATQQGAPIHGYVLLVHDLPRPKGAAADVALTGSSEILDVSPLGLDRFDESGHSRLATDPIALPFPERITSS